MYKISLTGEWKLYLGDKNKRIVFITSLVLLIIVLNLLTKWLDYAEERAGLVLNDPLLKLFTPVDLSWVIFAFIYASLFLSLFFLVRHPALLTMAIQAYTIMVIFRIAAMYAAPLDPPANTLPLPDPFVEIFSTGRTLTRDLFFSGHTATLFILFLTATHKYLKAFLLFSTIIVAAAVLIQHVHYTIDVLCAPFFAYGAYKIARMLKFNL